MYIITWLTTYTPPLTRKDSPIHRVNNLSNKINNSETHVPMVFAVQIFTCKQKIGKMMDVINTDHPRIGENINFCHWPNKKGLYHRNKKSSAQCNCRCDVLIQNDFKLPRGSDWRRKKERKKLAWLALQTPQPLNQSSEPNLTDHPTVLAGVLLGEVWLSIYRQQGWDMKSFDGMALSLSTENFRGKQTSGDVQGFGVKWGGTRGLPQDGGGLQTVGITQRLNRRPQLSGQRTECVCLLCLCGKSDSTEMSANRGHWENKIFTPQTHTWLELQWCSFTAAVVGDLRRYRSSVKHYRNPLPKVCVQHFLWETALNCIYSWSVYLFYV